MQLGNNSRRQAFADVVTIEAWHGEFAGGRRVDLHVDVVFGTARLGEESDSAMRFRLSLRRAEVVVVVPDAEPVSIDPSSVSRDAQKFVGKITETTERKEAKSIGGRIFGRFSKGSSVGISAELSGEKKTKRSERVEFSSETHGIVFTQSKNEDNNYRWILESPIKKSIEGRPWDGASSPRLALVCGDQASERVPPTVRVEIHCRREDLIISDLAMKDENLWASISEKFGFRNRLAAAESYIREKLISEGLRVENIEEAFSRITLSSVSANSGNMG